MNTYVIAYSSQFHVVIPDKYVSAESSYNLVDSDLPIPELTGFAFDGWYYESEFITEAQIGDEISSNITLYAKWIETEVSMTVGIGQYQFRMKRDLDDEKLQIDDPNTEEKLTLVVRDIYTTRWNSTEEFSALFDWALFDSDSKNISDISIPYEVKNTSESNNIFFIVIIIKS